MFGYQPLYFPLVDFRYGYSPAMIPMAGYPPYISHPGYRGEFDTFSTSSVKPVSKVIFPETEALLYAGHVPF